MYLGVELEQEFKVKLKKIKYIQYIFFVTLCALAMVFIKVILRNILGIFIGLKDFEKKYFLNSDPVSEGVIRRGVFSSRN